MEDAFKKFLYAGVDLAAEVSTKFEEGVKDLIEAGKISDVEGKKMVDELNGVLAGNEIKDPNKPILNDTSPKIIHKEHSAEEITDFILQQVSDDYLLEIAEQNFNNFNNRIYVLLDKYNVSAADIKNILLKIEESFKPQEEEQNEPETDNAQSDSE